MFNTISEFDVIKKNEVLDLQWCIDFQKRSYILKIQESTIVEERKVIQSKYWTYGNKEIFVNDKKRYVEIIELKQKNNKNIISNEFVEIFFDIISHMLNDDKSLFNILKNCEVLFEKQKRSIEESRLVGILGEMSFIYELYKIDKSVVQWFHSNQYMKFDLYAKEFNKYVEIKATMSGSQFFLLKDEQINGINNLFLGTVSLKSDDNGVDISFFLDLFSTTESDDLNEFVSEVSMLVEEYPEMKKNKINLNETIVKIFDCKNLPLPNVDFDNKFISDITYKLNTQSLNFIKPIDFFNLLKKN